LRFPPRASIGIQALPSRQFGRCPSNLHPPTVRTARRPCTPYLARGPAVDFGKDGVEPFLLRHSWWSASWRGLTWQSKLMSRRCLPSRGAQPLEDFDLSIASRQGPKPPTTYCRSGEHYPALMITEHPRSICIGETKFLGPETERPKSHSGQKTDLATTFGPVFIQDQSASGKRDSSAQRQTAQNRIQARNGHRGGRNAAARARQLRAPWPSLGNCRFERLRGGAGRIRTSNQTIMDCRRGRSCHGEGPYMCRTIGPSTDRRE
jgi:hypothetical protein